MENCEPCPDNNMISIVAKSVVCTKCGVGEQANGEKTVCGESLSLQHILF